MNKIENSSGQVDDFHINIKGLKYANHQMQQENAHMMERLGQFEIFESKLLDEVITTQAEKNEILLKEKVVHKKVATVITYLTRMKSVSDKL